MSQEEFQYQGSVARWLVDFPGYAVTEAGEVISFKGKSPRNLRSCNNKGYRMVCLKQSGRKTTTSVHRLVAKAFLPNPEGKREVNHKDSNRAHNHRENLEWVTPKENVQHALAGTAWTERMKLTEDLSGLNFELCLRSFTRPRAAALLEEGFGIFEIAQAVPGVTVKRRYIRSLSTSEKRELRKRGVLF